jgi:hypothetical protein
MVSSAGTSCRLLKTLQDVRSWSFLEWRDAGAVRIKNHCTDEVEKGYAAHILSGSVTTDDDR